MLAKGQEIDTFDPTWGMKIGTDLSEGSWKCGSLDLVIPPQKNKGKDIITDVAKLITKDDHQHKIEK